MKIQKTVCGTPKTNTTFLIQQGLQRTVGIFDEEMMKSGDILADEKYKYLFTVDEVNRLVMQGVPFRDAYKIVGKKVEDGSFTPPPSEGVGGRSHEGSIGNLCTKQIKKQMQKVVDSFPFASVKEAVEKLVK
jgi:argininosuccinate lyase